VPYHFGKIISKKSIRLARRARIARGGNQRRPKTVRKGAGMTGGGGREKRK
jgi:hypothetical protein